MKYKKILLTGGSGTLGSTILNSEIFQDIIAPNHEKLDILNKDKIIEFFQENYVDAVIHCAAFINLKEAENNLSEAIKVNIIGTSNLVKEISSLEKIQNKKIRFIHISTDAVYNRTEGNYSENSSTIPFDKYGWTKLGSESAVNLLQNFCIIRTSFFDPEKLNFQDSPIDAYSSKITLKELVDAIKLLLESDFIGTLNVGRKRVSHYELYKEFIHFLKPCKLEEIQSKVNHKLPKDSSMDISLWEKIKNKNI